LHKTKNTLCKSLWTSLSYDLYSVMGNQKALKNTLQTNTFTDEVNSRRTFQGLSLNPEPCESYLKRVQTGFSTRIIERKKLLWAPWNPGQSKRWFLLLFFQEKNQFLFSTARWDLLLSHPLKMLLLRCGKYYKKLTKIWVQSSGFLQQTPKKMFCNQRIAMTLVSVLFCQIFGSSVTLTMFMLSNATSFWNCIRAGQICTTIYPGKPLLRCWAS